MEIETSRLPMRPLHGGLLPYLDGSGSVAVDRARAAGPRNRTLGLATIRTYTDPSNVRAQRVLLHCGLKQAGEIELVKPTRHGARRALLFRISQQDLITAEK